MKEWARFSLCVSSLRQRVFVINKSCISFFDAWLSCFNLLYFSVNIVQRYAMLNQRIALFSVIVQTLNQFIALISCDCSVTQLTFEQKYYIMYVSCNPFCRVGRIVLRISACALSRISHGTIRMVRGRTIRAFISFAVLRISQAKTSLVSSNSCRATNSQVNCV